MPSRLTTAFQRRRLMVAPDAVGCKRSWDAEIERRIEAIEAGQITLEPWADVRRRIERDVLGR